MSARKKVSAVIRFVFLLPVHAYRLIISPLTPASCIYTPSCSKYFIEAVKKHGILKGGLLGTMRISRCTGFFYLGGPDPVPEEFSFSQAKKLYTLFRKHKNRKR